MTSLYLSSLMNDHSLIEKALVLIERQIQKKSKINFTALRTLFDFLLDYGDLCHNMKEEKVYFPLLLERGLPPSGPVGVMLLEHEEERKYINLIKSQLAEASAEKLPDDFISNINAYIDLTKNHIWKENDILYPMGKRILSPEDEIYLNSEFRKIEKESLGEGAYLRYSTLLDAMEKESGGKVDLLASLSTEVINNMLDALPVELSFVDADDRVRYYNKMDGEKIFTRSLSVIGRTVQQCHPQKSVHLVNQIIEEMRAGKRDVATFWINFENKYVHISYYAVRSSSGEYQGCVEMVHDIKPYREIEGEKRLLDEQ